MLTQAPEWAKTPRTIRKIMNVGIQLQNSYAWTTLYPNKVTRNVQAPTMMIPA